MEILPREKTGQSKKAETQEGEFGLLRDTDPILHREEELLERTLVLSHRFDEIVAEEAEKSKEDLVEKKVETSPRRPFYRFVIEWFADHQDLLGPEAREIWQRLFEYKGRKKDVTRFAGLTNEIRRILRPQWEEEYRSSLSREDLTRHEKRLRKKARKRQQKKHVSEGSVQMEHVKKSPAAVPSMSLVLHEREVIKKELKTRLQDIDAHKDYPADEQLDRKIVRYDDNTNRLFVLDEAGRHTIAWGDIVADYEWGIQYAPDRSVPRSVWRKVRKLSDITEARRKLERNFDEELNATFSRLNLFTMGYQFLAKDLECLEQTRDKEGLLAEYMVRSFLTRIQHNNPQLLFRFEGANIFEDAQLKYDFRVLVNITPRGIAIEGDDMPREEYITTKRRIGVQLTLVTGRFLSHKERRTNKGRKRLGSETYSALIKRPVADIVLISLPFVKFFESYNKWLRAGKPSRGPDQFLSREEKLEILEKVLIPYYTLSDEEKATLIL